MSHRNKIILLTLAVIATTATGTWLARKYKWFDRFKRWLHGSSDDAHDEDEFDDLGFADQSATPGIQDDDDESESYESGNHGAANAAEDDSRNRDVITMLRRSIHQRIGTLWQKLLRRRANQLDFTGWR